jgi:hypothetical protein
MFRLISAAFSRWSNSCLKKMKPDWKGAIHTLVHRVSYVARIVCTLEFWIRIRVFLKAPKFLTELVWSMSSMWLLLSLLDRWRKHCEKHPLVLSCLRETASLPLDRFLWHILLGSLTKVWRHNSVCVTSDEDTNAFLFFEGVSLSDSILGRHIGVAMGLKPRPSFFINFTGVHDLNKRWCHSLTM